MRIEISDYRLFQAAAVGMARGDVRYYLNGVYVTHANGAGLRYFATDGHFLTATLDPDATTSGLPKQGAIITPRLVKTHTFPTGKYGNLSRQPARIIVGKEESKEPCKFGRLGKLALADNDTLTADIVALDHDYPKYGKAFDSLYKDGLAQTNVASKMLDRVAKMSRVLKMGMVNTQISKGGIISFRFQSDSYDDRNFDAFALCMPMRGNEYSAPPDFIAELVEEHRKNATTP